jgi:predicted MFS family arabinose efflux permease
LAILASPVIFRRFGLVTGIMYTQIAAAISLGCLAVIPGASVAALVYAGYSAFQWMSEPGMFSLLMSRVADSERAGASALNFLVISSSQALAAAVAGASFGRFGYPTVLAVIALVALGAAVAFRAMLGKDLVTVPNLLQSSTNG